MLLLAMPPARINREFGAAVRQLLDERGLSLRQARNRTGVDTDTLSRMRQDEVPRLDKVEAFARGFGLDVNAWRVLGGYEPVRDNRPALERIREDRKELEYEPDLSRVTIRAFEGWDHLPPEDLEIIDDVLRALLTEDRQKRGN